MFQRLEHFLLLQKTQSLFSAHLPAHGACESSAKRPNPLSLLPYSFTGTAFTSTQNLNTYFKNNDQKKFLNAQDQTGKMTRPNTWRSLFEANMVEKENQPLEDVCISSADFWGWGGFF